MNQPNTTLDRIAAKAGRLYSLPAVAMKVLELTENPQVDTRALKQCIETDPALTGKVLRVVNSSLFGLSREVCDLNQALALLGTKPLKLLVLGFSLPPGLFDGLMGETLLRYWRHTLIKAVSAREICESLWKRPGDEAFLAGLLQDLGSLVLIQELGDPYVRFLEGAAEHQADPVELERRSLGFDRTQLSVRLLAHWRLPELLIGAVSLERPSGRLGQPAEPIHSVLRLAELVARLLGDGQTSLLGRLLEEGAAACDLTEPQLDTLIGSLEEKVQQLADALSVDLPSGTDYRDLVVEAQQRLADVAADVAGDLLASGTGAESRVQADPMQNILRALSELAEHSASEPPSPELCDDSLPAGGPIAPLRPADPCAGRSARQPAPPTVHAGRPCPQPACGPAAAAAATASFSMRLAGYVGAAAAACRRSRVPLSLMLVQLNEPEAVLRARGVRGLAEVRDQLEDACRNIDHPLRACLAHGDAGFAVILSDCERQAAVRFAQQLIRTIREMGTQDEPAALGVSVGVAAVSLPPVNFDPDLMLESAERCLYGARVSDGSVVKSIEI